jgi:hypothetical protein
MENYGNLDKLLDIQRHLTLGEQNRIHGVVAVKIKSVSIDQGLLSIQETFHSLVCSIQHRNFQTRTKSKRFCVVFYILILQEL